MSIESTLGSAGSEIVRSGKEVFINTPKNAKSRSKGPVELVANTAADMTLSAAGETARLSANVVGFVGKRTAKAAFDMMKWTGSAMVKAAVNTPLPIPSIQKGTSGDALSDIGPNALNRKLDQWNTNPNA